MMRTIKVDLIVSAIAVSSSMGLYRMVKGLDFDKKGRSNRC